MFSTFGKKVTFHIILYFFIRFFDNFSWNNTFPFKYFLFHFLWFPSQFYWLFCILPDFSFCLKNGAKTKWKQDEAKCKFTVLPQHPTNDLDILWFTTKHYMVKKKLSSVQIHFSNITCWFSGSFHEFT